MERPEPAGSSEGKKFPVSPHVFCSLTILIHGSVFLTTFI